MLPASTAVDYAVFGSFFHIHLIIFNCTVKTVLGKGLLYDKKQKPQTRPLENGMFYCFKCYS